MASDIRGRQIPLFVPVPVGARPLNQDERSLEHLINDGELDEREPKLHESGMHIVTPANLRKYCSERKEKPY